jgi:hypothetical protein
MSSQFKPIQIPPGVVAMPTKNMSSTNWAEVNLMRWVEGELQPIGGQAQYVYPPFASRCKAIHGWYDLAGIYHIAYVCEQNVYVDTSGALTEITPTGGWPAPPLPTQGGYGDMLYSAEDYGTPRSTSSILSVDQIPNMWSVDNFGSILVVQYSADGRLLSWDPGAAAGTILTRVTGSPMGRCFVVTSQRFIIMFGTTEDGTTGGGSFRRFAWCDQEVMTDWDYTSVVNQAGFLDIEPASPIITAMSGRFGTIMFTAKKAYLIQFLGLPYVYNYVELADNCTPWSPLSITSTSSYVLWMSDQGMFSFDGTTIAPIACLVRPWITDDIDPSNVREQAFAYHDAQFNEFWWFYPQSVATNASGDGWNTRCVYYNYKEGWWGQGQMSRSAGITSSYTVQPILADGLIAFQHELGNVYVNAANPFAETFDLNLASGTVLTTLKQVIPDVKGDFTNVQFSFFSRRTRSNGDTGFWSPPVSIRSNGYVDARVTGRDIRMKISVVGGIINAFTVGQHQVDAVPRGDR